MIDPLDVVENLFLNREHTRGGRLGAWLGVLDKKRMRAESGEILGRLDIRIPSLRRPMSALSGGQRQAVAIGRAAAWGQQIVLLDEPAAALGVEQAARVLDLVRSLRDAGRGGAAHHSQHGPRHRGLRPGGGAAPGPQDRGGGRGRGDQGRPGRLHHRRQNR